MDSTSKLRPGVQTILVSVQLPGVSEAELNSSLDELQRLAKTLGLRVTHRLTQPRPNTNAPTVLGAGKLMELAKLTGGSGVIPAGASKRQTGSTPKEDESAFALEVMPDTDEVDPDKYAGVVLFDHDLTPAQIRNLEGAISAEVLDRTSVILSIFQRHARTREACL